MNEKETTVNRCHACNDHRPVVHAEWVAPTTELGTETATAELCADCFDAFKIDFYTGSLGDVSRLRIKELV